MRQLLLALGALLALGGVAHAADPDALWKIISEKCVPDEQDHGQPDPCAVVDLGDKSHGGYVILKDINGATQFLAMPTAKITGIEDPAILEPGARNYFADAWDQRHFTIEAAKTALPRDALSLAINSPSGRTQDQLHIHIDCIRPDVRATLQREFAAIGDKWTPLPEPLLGHPYRAMRIMGDGLDGSNPFLLLADGVPGARAAMGRHTLALIGATFAGGAPGFVLLDDEANPATGDRGSAEELQDHSCALAHP
jgi:CDP-diacylglycerol pyrophosphatase